MTSIDELERRASVNAGVQWMTVTHAELVSLGDMALTVVFAAGDLREFHVFDGCSHELCPAPYLCNENGACRAS